MQTASVTGMVADAVFLNRNWTSCFNNAIIKNQVYYLEKSEE